MYLYLSITSTIVKNFNRETMSQPSVCYDCGDTRPYHTLMSTCKGCKRLICINCLVKGENGLCGRCSGICVSCLNVADPDNKCVKCKDISCDKCWVKGRNDCCKCCTKKYAPKPKKKPTTRMVSITIRF